MKGLKFFWPLISEVDAQVCFFLVTIKHMEMLASGSVAKGFSQEISKSFVFSYLLHYLYLLI